MKKMIVAASILLAACSQQSNNDAKPAPRAPGVLGGVVADNLIRNADVTVYRLGEDGKSKEILQTTKTDAKGNYKQSIKVADTYVKLCAENGSYTEEASGVEVKMQEGQKLCAVAYYQTGRTHDVMVTPETNLAAALVECKASNSKDSINNIVSDANTSIGTLFGYNILTTKPADILDTEAKLLTLNDNTMSSMWHAAYSKLALKIAKENGLSNHSQSINSIAIHQAIYEDVSTDCKLDGLGAGGKKLSLGTFDLNTKVYRTELPRALADFTQSDANKTNIKLTDVVINAQQFSQSTDVIYQNTEQPILYDEEAPKLSVKEEDGKFISGVYSLNVNVSDRSAISEIYLIFGNEKIQGIVSNNIVKFNINTKLYQDGNFNVEIHAMDVLNNKSVLKRIFRIANDDPRFILKSERISKSTIYELSIELENLVAGIKTAKVNGADLSKIDNLLKADLTLAEGENKLEIIIIDNSDKTHSYNIEVDVDTTKPVVKDILPLEWKALVKKDGNIEAMPFKTTISDKLPIWVSSANESLKFIEVSYNSLLVNKWPTLVFEVIDPKIGGVGTDRSEFEITIGLIRGAGANEQLVFSRKVVLDDKNRLLVPFSNEYLGKDWHLNNNQLKEKRVLISIKDSAGNIRDKLIPFVTAPSLPSAKIVSKAGFISSKDKTITIEKEELSYADTVYVSVNGGSRLNVTEKESIDLDSVLVKNGENYADFTIIQNGVLTKNRQTFRADFVAPNLTFTSSKYSKSSSYTVKGIANDTYSGIDRVEVNGTRAEITNGTFKSQIDLSVGKNQIDIIAFDKANNETKISKLVYHDKTKPSIGIHTNHLRYKVKYFSNNKVVEGSLAFDTKNVFYIPENYMVIGTSNPSHEKILENSPNVNYLFIPFAATDATGNNGGLIDGETPENELQYRYSFKIGDNYFFKNRDLNLNQNVRYFLPIVSEFFDSDSGDGFEQYVSGKKLTVEIDAIDKAGNMSTLAVSFYMTVAPKPPTIGFNIGTNNTPNLLFSNRYAYEGTFNSGQNKIINNSSKPIYIKMSGRTKLEVKRDLVDRQLRYEYSRTPTNYYKFDGGVSFTSHNNEVQKNIKEIVRGGLFNNLKKHIKSTPSEWMSYINAVRSDGKIDNYFHPDLSDDFYDTQWSIGKKLSPIIQEENDITDLVFKGMDNGYSNKTFNESGITYSYPARVNNNLKDPKGAFGIKDNNYVIATYSKLLCVYVKPVFGGLKVKEIYVANKSSCNSISGWSFHSKHEQYELRLIGHIAGKYHSYNEGGIEKGRKYAFVTLECIKMNGSCPTGSMKSVVIHKQRIKKALLIVNHLNKIDSKDTNRRTARESSISETSFNNKVIKLEKGESITLDRTEKYPNISTKYPSCLPSNDKITCEKGIEYRNKFISNVSYSFGGNIWHHLETTDNFTSNYNVSDSDYPTTFKREFTHIINPYTGKRLNIVK